MKMEHRDTKTQRINSIDENKNSVPLCLCVLIYFGLDYENKQDQCSPFAG